MGGMWSLPPGFTLLLRVVPLPYTIVSAPVLFTLSWSGTGWLEEAWCVGGYYATLSSVYCVFGGLERSMFVWVRWIALRLVGSFPSCGSCTVVPAPIFHRKPVVLVWGNGRTSWGSALAGQASPDPPGSREGLKEF